MIWLDGGMVFTSQNCMIIITKMMMSWISIVYLWKRDNEHWTFIDYWLLYISFPVRSGELLWWDGYLVLWLVLFMWMTFNYTMTVTWSSLLCAGEGQSVTLVANKHSELHLECVVWHADYKTEKWMMAGGTECRTKIVCFLLTYKGSAVHDFALPQFDGDGKTVACTLLSLQK